MQTVPVSAPLNTYYCSTGYVFKNSPVVFEGLLMLQLLEGTNPVISDTSETIILATCSVKPGELEAYLRSQHRQHRVSVRRVASGCLSGRISP
jgi:hypothetical protein